MSVKPARKVKSAARGMARKAKRTIARIPGPSSNPATNLLMWDIAARGLTMVVGRQIEKTMLKLRHGPEKAAEVVEDRSMVKALAATSAASFATKSLPGFVVVASVLLAKTAFDRGLRPRKSRQRVQRQIADRAPNAGD